MGWETSDRRARLPKDWDKRRLVVLERDGHRCRSIDVQGDRCPDRATEVDHVNAGDNHDVSSLQSLCAWHHRLKTNAEAAAARRRFPRRRPPERHPGLL